MTKSELLLLILSNFLIFCTRYISCVDGPIVCLTNGCVQGVDKDYFEAFMGIPFAKPPVGDLRFRNPVPIGKWNGILNATEEKPVCVQKNVLFPDAQIQGVEDCLYLYVYRPKNNAGCTFTKLPVMIYIYGGGFFAGIAGPSVDGPEYFMETQQVVMVFMAYRVAALGFLSTGDDAMPGNLGLKDQALAIKWTVKNIEYFGGDPKSITVLGQSAGAASTHFHMFSPQTQNLFHRAILLSGSAIASYSYVNQNPHCQAITLAIEAGIQNAQELNSAQLVNELRKLTPETIIEASERIKFWDVDPLVMFHPVIEKCEFDEFNETSSFLCDDPRELWRKGQHSNIPILAGNTEIEGGVRAFAIIENDTMVQSLNKVLPDYLPRVFSFMKSSQRELEPYLNKTLKAYFNGKRKITSKNSFGLVDIYSDRYFVQPLIRNLREYLSVAKNRPPFYIYKFDFQGPLSYSTVFSRSTKYYGVIHCDELIYTLRSPALFPELPANSTETKFRKIWIDFLIGFAKEGKVLNSEPCREYDLGDTSKCPYTYFGRPFRSSDKIIITQKYDLPLKLDPFWKQIEGVEDAIPNCDIFSKKPCLNKYCC